MARVIPTPTDATIIPIFFLSKLQYLLMIFRQNNYPLNTISLVYVSDIFWLHLNLYKSFLMVVGAGITLGKPLALKIMGISIFTFGYLGSYSLASSWVGHQDLHDKSQASSLYLFFFYASSSIVGTSGGIFGSVWCGWRNHNDFPPRGEEKYLQK